MEFGSEMRNGFVEPISGYNRYLWSCLMTTEQLFTA